MSDTVCVVGAGGSGLAAAHALKQRGIPYRVFERRDGIGGMWRQGPGSHAYDALESNTSRWRTSFRAMRMRPSVHPFVHHAEFLAYLERFADRFGIEVETGADVECVEPAGDGWDVTVAGREPERFRAVIAATAILAEPHRPRWPGDFDGTLI